MLTVFKNNTLLDNFFNDFYFDNSKLTSRSSYNLYDNENGYVIELLVPGFNKQNLSIEIENNQIFVKGENNKKDDSLKYQSFSYHSINKVFNIPENVDTDDIEAEVIDGILKINLPKRKTKKEKRKVIELI